MHLEVKMVVIYLCNQHEVYEGLPGIFLPCTGSEDPNGLRTPM